MWDWLKALWDGGFSGLLLVALVACALCLVWTYFRSDMVRERDYWVACAIAFAFFAWSPAFDWIGAAFQDHPTLLPLGVEPSALTPGKALVLDAIGAIAGRIGYVVFAAFVPMTR